MAFITTKKDGHVAIITIDRPEALNALNTAVLLELENHIDAAETDSDIRVAIITGSGKAFVAGADISEMANMTKKDALEFALIGTRVMRRVDELPFPVIAAVNGYALGGGCELAMACSIRYASKKAKFGQPEVSLGITPGFGGTQRLPRIVGTSHALELILSGKTISADRAKEIGLVNDVFEPEELMEKALETAHQIASNAPFAVAAAKSLIERMYSLTIRDDLSAETKRFTDCFNTSDQKMGMKAFLEKRPHDEYKGE